MKIHRTRYHGYNYAITICKRKAQHKYSTHINSKVTCKKCLAIIKNQEATDGR